MCRRTILRLSRRRGIGTPLTLRSSDAPEDTLGIAVSPLILRRVGVTLVARRLRRVGVTLIARRLRRVGVTLIARRLRRVGVTLIARRLRSVGVALVARRLRLIDVAIDPLQARGESRHARPVQGAQLGVQQLRDHLPLLAPHELQLEGA
eukprot:scaffold14742_cov58-Phaeocystis_antarctica.AAC.3